MIASKKRLHFTVTELGELEIILRARIEHCEEAIEIYDSTEYDEDLALLRPMYKRVEAAWTALEPEE